MRRALSRSPRIRLAILDWIILAASLALLVFLTLAVRSSREGELSVVVGGSGQEWIYPLGEDRIVEIPGPLGSTVVEIQGGHVHIAASPCPNQTCVASGGIDAAGQWLACLPNQVFVRVEGRAEDDSVDAGVY
jgi:hypothetical protein